MYIKSHVISASDPALMILFYFIFFFYGTMLIFFMYEKLSECIFTYNKTVVCFLVNSVPNLMFTCLPGSCK